MFQRKRFTARVIGNFLISFLSPLVGANIILNVDFLHTIYLSLISSFIVTGLVIGRELERYGTFRNRR